MVPNNKTVERYVVAEGKTPQHLRVEIEELMRKGFQPYGATMQVGQGLAQPMVVYKETIEFLGVIDADSPFLLHKDDMPAWFPEPYKDPDPFVVRNVMGSWVMEFHRSESPYTIPDTPVIIVDTEGNVLATPTVSSVKGETITVFGSVLHTGLFDNQGQYSYTAWVPAATPGMSTTITRWEKLADMSTEVLTAEGIWNDRLTLNYA